MIAGSNPNENVETRTYATEFRTEMLFPVRLLLLVLICQRSRFL